MFITHLELKEWNYYSFAAKNFPKVPAAIREQTNGLKGFKTEIIGASAITSLRSFKRRVANYMQQHMASQNLRMFDPNHVKT